jgi:EAL domain-containing protein (putative c-di-GMP-specific phosphodiesterase class I)
MLALNVSPLQLRDALLPVQLLSILNETGFPARRIEIEITETALVTDLPAAKSILTALQSLGLKIALDDFGTGHSSLAHLHEMRFDKIKIDRSFVQSMGTNAESADIVAAILGLTKSLDLPTTAEGIEDAETLRLMIAGGCAYGQGYYFGKAMPAHEAAAFAKSQVEPNVPELAA